jgi:predicted nucleic acid-binding protein
MIAVMNSSPCIFLSKLGITEPALRLFDRTVIPSSVKDEVFSKYDEAADTLEKLQKEKRLTVLGSRNVRLLNALKQRIGKGEAEAIAIAVEIGADIIILDDHAARVEALRLGFQVKGTLGIIKKLIESGRFECSLSELLENLKKMNFRVKDSIFWRIFRDVGDHIH